MCYNYFYRILAAIHYFNGTAHFSDIKICIHPVLPTYFLSVYFKHQSPWNKLLIEATIFSEKHRLYWNENSHLKQLLLFNNFYLVTNSFLISFFLKIISFPAQLLFQEASRSPKLEFLKKIPPSSLKSSCRNTCHVKLYFLSMLRRSHDWL